jgi:hypothetical protein
MRRPLPALVLLLALAVLAAGCGRPEAKVEQLPTGQLSKKDYVRAFEVSANGLAQRYGVPSDDAGGAKPAQQDARVAALQRFLRAWADRLAGLHPPAEAQRAQVRFVAGVRGFADDLDRVRARLERGDVRGAQRLLDTGAVVSAQTKADLEAARARFHDLDYDIANLDKTPVKTD